MSKQPEKTERTRKAFIDAFCILYSQKPIEQISVQEIANKAGYNRSSFYQHFCDIYDLLNILENDVLDSLRKELSKGERSFQDILALFNGGELYVDALFGDYGGTHFIERVKASVLHEAHHLTTTEADLVSPYLMEFHLSTVLSLYRLWRRRQRDIPAEDLLRLIHNLYTGGISAVAK